MIIRALTLLLAGLMVSSAALAESPRDPTEVRVSVKDVNFANPTDVAKLYRRLRIATYNACDSDIDTATAHAADRACAAKALDGAVQAVAQPSLLALYSGSHDLKVASNRP